MRNATSRTVAIAVALVTASIAFGSCRSGEEDKREAPVGQGTTVVPEVSQVPRLGGDAKATKDPEGVQTLSALPKARRADRTTVTPRVADAKGLALPQALDALSDDVGTFWQGIFNQSGLNFTPGEQAVITPGGPPVSTRCAKDGGAQDVSSDFPAAFYCAPDDRVFLPVTWFVDVVAPSGDAAVATVVAHQWGHRVQDLVGVNPDDDPQWQRGPGFELMADCLAGLWMASVYERGAYKQSDVQKGLDIAEKGAKKGEDPPKGIPEGALAHGSPQDRMDAFALGYDSADPARCQDITPEGL